MARSMNSRLTWLQMKFYALLALLVGIPCSGQSVADPTWSDNVACIVYSHCTGCHRPGGIAPFDLLTYTDAYNVQFDMVTETQGKFMPPWPPDEEYSSLAHERTLTQDEIDIIAEWVSDGAPEGDPANAPTPPVYTSSWAIAQPGLSVVMDDYVVPATSADLYRCFVLPSNTSVDTYIHGLEVVPGNQDIVHHVLVYQDVTGQAAALDAQSIEPGYTSFGGIGVSSAELIGIWVPGSSPFFTPPGMSIKLEQGADIVIQVHYPFGSSGQIDSTRVNLELGAQTLRSLKIEPLLDHIFAITNGPLAIPPNQVVTFHEEFTVPINATIVGIGPHAHLVCTSMWSYAITPTNDTIHLIDIPKWDLHWQDIYMFPELKKIPSGSVLHGYATYDNTTNNINNPNSPPQWVLLGEATNDEMMLFYFPWTIYLPGDENIVVDTTSHTAHHLACDPTVVGVAEHGISEVGTVWPTLASDVLHINFHGQSKVQLNLYSSSGQLVLSQQRMASDRVDISSLARGVYNCEVKGSSGGLLLRTKLVLE